MRFPVEKFEALARHKKRAADEQARPAKRALRGARAGPAETTEAPPVRAPVEESVKEAPAEGVVPGLARAETEEGEIPAATEAAMVVLDPEEEVLAATDSVEAGQVAIVRSPPAPVEPEMEKALPTARKGEAAATSSRAGATRSSEHRAEKRSSSRRSAHLLTQQPPDEPLGGPARSAPRLLTMEDAGRAAALLSRAQTLVIDKEIGRQSHAALLDMVMVNVLQLANGALALRAAVSHTGEVLTLTIGRANKYKEQARALFEKLARQQEEAKVREEDLGGRVKEAERRAEVEGGRASTAMTQLSLVSSRLDSSRAEIEELHRLLQYAEGRTDTAAGEARAAMERAAIAEAAAVDAGHERLGRRPTLMRPELENKAWEAEARAREAEANAETRAWEVEAKAKVQI